MRILLVALAFLIMAPSVWAKSQFNYFVKIQATQASCPEEATHLGLRFAQATHLTVVQSKCVDESDSVYSLSLDYLADSAASPYSAILNSAMAGVSDNDYPTLASCVADIPAQSEAFAKYTKLIAVSTSCALESEGRYVIRVDGFGEPAESLQSFRIALSGTPTPAYLNDSVSLITKLGGSVVLRGQDGRISFYSVEALSLNRAVLGDFFADIHQCRSQLDAARAIGTAAGAKTIVADCLPSRSGIAGAVSLEVVYDSPAILASDFGQNAPSYSSFQACMADRARALLAITEKQGAPVLGGICVSNNDSPDQFILQSFSAE